MLWTGCCLASYPVATLVLFTWIICQTASFYYFSDTMYKVNVKYSVEMGMNNMHKPSIHLLWLLVRYVGAVKICVND